MARSYRLGFVRRLINKLVQALVRLGLGPKHTYLLTVVGRKSGRPFTTPVTLVEHPGGERWLVSPYGERQWTKNARSAGSVELRRGRSRETTRLTELSPAEAAPVLREYLQMAPVTRPFFDVATDAPDNAFVREAPKHPVFRLLPAPGRTRGAT